MPNFERIRERIFTGHKHNHDGRHANQMRLDAAIEAQEHEYQSEDFDHHDLLPDYKPGIETEIVSFPQVYIAPLDIPEYTPIDKPE